MDRSFEPVVAGRYPCKNWFKEMAFMSFCTQSITVLNVVFSLRCRKIPGNMVFAGMGMEKISPPNYFLRNINTAYMYVYKCTYM